MHVHHTVQDSSEPKRNRVSRLSSLSVSTLVVISSLISYFIRFNSYQTNATIDELFKVAPAKKPQKDADSNKRHKQTDQNADSQAPDGVYVRKKKQIKK